MILILFWHISENNASVVQRLNDSQETPVMKEKVSSKLQVYLI